MNVKLAGVGLVLIFVSAACAPLADSPTAAPTPELPEGVVAARVTLSESLDIPLGQVEVVSYEQREWTDGCLGLGGPDEACIQVITSGYRVILQAEDDIHVYRTDETGNAVRREE